MPSSRSVDHALEHFRDAFDKVFLAHGDERITKYPNVVEKFYNLYKATSERNLDYAIFDALDMIMDDLRLILYAVDTVEEQYVDLRKQYPSVDFSKVLANAFLADVRTLPNNAWEDVEKVVSHLYELIGEYKIIPGKEGIYVGNHKG